MTKHFFSIGYRCSSASLLKHLGIKTQSYPFDWMVSRLSIIKHCIETEFQEFIDPKNYVSIDSSTSDYPDNTINSRVFICEEKVDYNSYYESNFPIPRHSIPKPIEAPRDAYGYKLMMNHRYLKTDEDYQYYKRCIERWNTLMMSSSDEKVSLYVHPALSYDEYLEYQIGLFKEFTDFHQYMNTKTANFSSIFIVPVRTDKMYPITKHVEHVVEKIQVESGDSAIHVYILWCNRDFIDAGEIFMGNMWIETDELVAVLKTHL